MDLSTHSFQVILFGLLNFSPTQYDEFLLLNLVWSITYIYIWMMLRTRHLLTSFSTSISPLTQYITPVTVQPHQLLQMPTLKLRSQKAILQNWWGLSPFDTKQNLKVPVFSFQTNQYNGTGIELPAEIFNQPLRRDLIYRLHHYRSNLNKFRTKKTRNRAETAGSGRKVRPQKKMGMARQGDKRAPHLKKGGKSHGAKPMVYSTLLNSKIKLKALCSLLTAKLAEGKIKIIDQQKVTEPKSKVLAKIVSSHFKDERTLLCFITSKKVDPNFALAHRNLKRVIWHDTYNLDVKSLFIADKIYITVAGMEELINNIRKTKYVIYKQPYMPSIEEKAEQNNAAAPGQVLRWDPEKPYEFKFRILAQYLDLYEKVRKETPELLDMELKKIRKIQSL